MTTTRTDKTTKPAKPAIGGERGPRGKVVVVADKIRRGYKYKGQGVKGFVLHGRAYDSAIAEILGVEKERRDEPKGMIAWHDLLKVGLPAKAVGRLVEHTEILGRADYFSAALGMSPRTLQRMKTSTSKRLSTEQSGRVFKFAEVLAKAIDVFGTQEAAEEWLASPALALDGRRPVELLETAVGQEAVEKVLIRLDYGVYT